MWSESENEYDITSLDTGLHGERIGGEFSEVLLEILEKIVYPLITFTFQDYFLVVNHATLYHQINGLLLFCRLVTLAFFAPAGR